MHFVHGMTSHAIGQYHKTHVIDHAKPMNTAHTNISNSWPSSFSLESHDLVIMNVQSSETFHRTLSSVLGFPIYIIYYNILNN